RSLRPFPMIRSSSVRGYTHSSSVPRRSGRAQRADVSSPKLAWSLAELGRLQQEWLLAAPGATDASSSPRSCLRVCAACCPSYLIVSSRSCEAAEGQASLGPAGHRQPRARPLEGTRLASAVTRLPGPSGPALPYGGRYEQTSHARMRHRRFSRALLDP